MTKQATPLVKLHDLGQSIWLDFVSRDMLDAGELEQFIETRSITGVTSNPSIFKQALADTKAYDNDIAAYMEQGLNDRDIFAQLAVEDIRRACDVMRPVWVASGRQDGMVSIEVEPDLARRTAETVKRAQELWDLVDRPNVMIKVPATDEGLPAIEELLFEGINVNVTLLFSVRQYRQVMERYLSAIERRRDDGRNAEVHSVASFFVSRVDSAIDAMLDDNGGSALELRGAIAVANARVAFDAYLSVFTTDRFVKELRPHGFRPQRPLWASTSTKNPDYPDLLYVEPLIAAGSVNTMPLNTLEAFADHGTAATSIDDGSISRSHAQLGELREFGIDLDQVTDELLVQGVTAFEDAYHDLLTGIREKRAQLMA